MIAVGVNKAIIAFTNEQKATNLRVNKLENMLKNQLGQKTMWK